MQLGTLFSLFLISLSLTQGEDVGPQHLKINTIKNIAACKQEHNARREDYDAIKRSETPSTPEGKCFLECLFNKFHVTEGGKYSAVSFGKRVDELYKDDPDNQRKARQMVKDCENILGDYSNPSKCQYAVKVLECMASYTSKVELIKDLLKFQKI